MMIYLYIFYLFIYLFILFILFIYLFFFLGGGEEAFAWKVTREADKVKPVFVSIVCSQIVTMYRIVCLDK